MHNITAEASPKSQEYMDSLVPPSPENFQRIAHIQEEKEEEIKRRSRDQRLQVLHEQEERLAHGNEIEKADAAQKIQRIYRGYRTRRELEGYGLDATTRWISALREAEFRHYTQPHARSTESVDASTLGSRGGAQPSSAKQNWKKASIVARRAGHDDLESGSSSSLLSEDDEEATPHQKDEARRKREDSKSKRKHEARMMGLQYFLEMVDLSHRYGSNLRSYFEVWKQSDTNENFFYWLDYGEGKTFELSSCPRDRLDRERVRYLSREERQYYLVEVDSEGRLCWSKNGARIDTTEQYRDSIHGIVPTDDPTPVFNPSVERGPSQDSDSEDSSRSSMESKREADRAAKYATPEFEQAKGLTKVTHLSASTIFNKLLRKSVRKNTWIFVADTSFKLYIGIKTSGAFQHSSFLQGGRISAAGLIKIKNGRLSSLSPLSGHYRPPAANFRAFVHSLKDSGADMSHVSISKSYTVLVGLEAYIKTRRKGKRLASKVVHGRDKVLAPEEVERRKEEAKDKSESAELERQFLEKQRLEEEERDENRAGLKMMRKLKIAPIVPKGQKGGKDEEANAAAGT